MGLSRHPFSLSAFRHVEDSLRLQSVGPAAHTLSSVLFPGGPGVAPGHVWSSLSCCEYCCRRLRVGETGYCAALSDPAGEDSGSSLSPTHLRLRRTRRAGFKYGEGEIWTSRKICSLSRNDLGA